MDDDDDMKICCVKLSLAARVIAMVGLITSVLILTQLSTELADPESSGGSVSILLGLDVEEFKYTIGGDDRQRKTDATEIMIAFLLFSFFYAVSSAILIWGTIVEQSWCALPWLICVAFSFATQVATLAIHAIALKTRKNKLIIAISVLNIGLTVYFWIVVFCAQRTWRRGQSGVDDELHKQLQRESRTVQAAMVGGGVVGGRPRVPGPPSASQVRVTYGVPLDDSRRWQSAEKQLQSSSVRPMIHLYYKNCCCAETVLDNYYYYYYYRTRRVRPCLGCAGP